MTYNDSKPNQFTFSINENYREISSLAPMYSLCNVDLLKNSNFQHELYCIFFVRDRGREKPCTIGSCLDTMHMCALPIAFNLENSTE